MYLFHILVNQGKIKVVRHKMSLKIKFIKNSVDK